MSTNTKQIVHVTMARGFAQSMVALLGAVITFLNWAKTKAAVLQIQDPSRHVEGLKLLRAAIEDAVNTPLPETSFRFGIAQDETENHRDNSVVFEITGNADWLQRTLPHVVAGANAITAENELTNAEEVHKELTEAMATVRDGDDYDGQVVKVTRRERQS